MGEYEYVMSDNSKTNKKPGLPLSQEQLKPAVFLPPYLLSLKKISRKRFSPDKG